MTNASSWLSVIISIRQIVSTAPTLISTYLAFLCPRTLRSMSLPSVSPSRQRQPPHQRIRARATRIRPWPVKTDAPPTTDHERVPARERPPREARVGTPEDAISPCHAASNASATRCGRPETPAAKNSNRVQLLRFCISSERKSLRATRPSCSSAVVTPCLLPRPDRQRQAAEPACFKAAFAPPARGSA